MPTAALLIRPDNSHYSRPEYVQGLKAAGFDILEHPADKPKPGDVLVSWNRHGIREHYAQRYEAAGAKVIVTENGWIDRTPDGQKFYSLCLSQHNGPGQWRVGESDRFSGLGINFQPWREKGGHILVLASRGIGSPAVKMPRDWPANVMKRLARITNRPVRLRTHPGQTDRPLEPDLKGAHAVVTWASGAAIKAIAAGIPAFYELKGWIGATASKRGIDEIEAPFLGDRLPMFRRLAWAQFTAQEIASGWPMKHLLGAA